MQERPELTGLKTSTGRPVIDAGFLWASVIDSHTAGGPYQLEQVLTGHIGVVSLAGAQSGAQHEYRVRHVDDAENANSFGFEQENASLCLQPLGCNHCRSSKGVVAPKVVVRFSIVSPHGWCPARCFAHPRAGN